jgi:hypothetical protein
MSARWSARRVVPLVLLASLLFSGCDLVGGGEDSNEPTASPPTSAAVDQEVVAQFTRDGTFQSHLAVRGAPDVDFVFTIYPTKATPRTNEWYPKGKKFFSFTFTAYDLAQRIRAPFDTKRLVYLKSVKVTSATVTSKGGRTQRPYSLDVVAADATFDPQPVTTRYGMLITSPKGAFELRNQAIGGMSVDTVGVNLTFKAVVNVQQAAGSSAYVERTVTQVVPVTIFESDGPTRATRIPVNAG